MSRHLDKHITWNLMHFLYAEQKKSVKHIGELLHRAPTTISRYLKRFGIEARPFSTTGLRTWLGKKHSEATKKKLSVQAIGRKIPLAVRLRMGSKGKKNPGYIDGRYPINKRIRNSAEAHYWREQVFGRDNFTCQSCGKRGGDLHADHIKPFALYPDLRFDLNNGRTMCIPCHRQTDTYGAKLYKKVYTGV